MVRVKRLQGEKDQLKTLETNLRDKKEDLSIEQNKFDKSSDTLFVQDREDISF